MVQFYVDFFILYIPVIMFLFKCTVIDSIFIFLVLHFT